MTRRSHHRVQLEPENLPFDQGLRGLSSPTPATPRGERRQEFLDAALELFLEKGFDETTVQNIATRAGVAIGTMYLYFPSKNDVILALHNDFHKGMEERFLAGAGEYFATLERGEQVDNRDAIDDIIDSMFEYILEHRRECEVLTRHLWQSGISEEVMAAERHFIEFLSRAIEAGTQTGLLHASDPQMSAYLLNAAMHINMARAITFGDPPDVDRLAAGAKELFYKALAPATVLELPPRKPSQPDSSASLE
ncbi:MAG: TetR/AcrR family transcriptional regulator [Actinomycetota bacterium]